jgi:16S rRNA (cytidine(1402)-2'-O)-methyltransferase
MSGGEWERELVLALLADSTLASLVGQSVDLDARPQGDPLPGIVLFVISDARPRHMKGEIGFRESRVQADVYAADGAGVRAVREAGLPVVPVPGACAAIAALSVAGIPSDRFCFEGFLPVKGGARRERLGELLSETRTLVFYESSHRIEESLADLVAVFGAEREATLGRELTKRFETLLGPTLGAIQQAVASDANQRKGEFVLVVRGSVDREAAQLAEGKRLYAKLAAHLKPSQAAKLAAELSGAPRKALYVGGDSD